MVITEHKPFAIYVMLLIVIAIAFSVVVKAQETPPVGKLGGGGIEPSPPSDDGVEVARAVQNWQLMVSMQTDAQQAHDTTLTTQTAGKSWWDDMLEGVGLQKTPEEMAVQARQDIIDERLALENETYDVQQNELTDANIIIGQRDVLGQVDIQCPDEQDENNNTVPSTRITGCYGQDIVQQPVYESFQLVVTPTALYKIPTNIHCFQDDIGIICENQYRCDMLPGRDIGCDAQTIAADPESIWDNNNLPPSMIASLETQHDIITNEEIP